MFFFYPPSICPNRIILVSLLRLIAINVIVPLCLIVGLITLAFFLSGCAALVVGSLPSSQSKDERSLKIGIPDFFNVARTMPDIQFTKKRILPHFTAKNFSFATYHEEFYTRNKTIRGELYFPENQRGSDIFIVLPISRGDIPSDWVAQAIVKSGFRAVRIDSDFKLLSREVIAKASNEIDAASAVSVLSQTLKHDVRQYVINLMRLMDFLEKGSDEPITFHAIGLSQGGIVANLLAGVDPRVKSLMMIVSSAKIARIVLDPGISEVGAVRDLQYLLYDQFGLSYQEALRLLESGIREIEPTTYASRLDRNSILLVSGGLDMLGLLDTAIPLSAAKKTWKLYGKPEWVIMLFTGHVTSALGFLPFWIEIPYVTHTLGMFFSAESYLAHLINSHFLPMALGRKE